MEVSGDFAHFSRNDSCGHSERSYSCPTYSAVENMFGSIMSWDNVRIIPTRVEICNPLRYELWKQNDEVSLKGKNTQYTNIVLRDVRYRLFAILGSEFHPQYNPRHAFQVRFNCRLKYKKKLKNPFMYLGKREFIADFNHLSETSKPNENINEPILGMFRRLEMIKGVMTPTTFPELQIKNGVLTFP